MGEYISRETVLKELGKNSITKRITLADGVSIYDTIHNIPTADVVEVKHGEWIEGKTLEKCSLCGKKGFSDWHYCPACGAKMDGGSDV